MLAMRMTRNLAAPAALLFSAAIALSGCDVPADGTASAPPQGETTVVTRGPATPPVVEQVAPLPSPGPNKVLAIVDVSEQRMTVVRGFDDGREPEQYRWAVSTGIERLPTPIGSFYPDFLSPKHVSSIYNVPMPWSVFFKGNYAVHGDPDARMLGQRASHGCVRVHPIEAEIFYKMVEEVGLRNTSILVRE